MKILKQPLSGILYVKYFTLVMTEEHERDCLEQMKLKSFNTFHKTKYFCCTAPLPWRLTCHTYTTGIVQCLHTHLICARWTSNKYSCSLFQPRFLKKNGVQQAGFPLRPIFYKISYKNNVIYLCCTFGRKKTVQKAIIFCSQ